MISLRECLKVEVIGGKDKKFTWFRTIRHAIRQPRRRFLFWWRIASYIYQTSDKRGRKFATKINRCLIRKYNTEIGLGAKIKPGMTIPHYNGIVISSYCTIGENFIVRQGVTIGISTLGKNDNEYKITIGNNVIIGANSCIISDDIKIGDNVQIGAMSFVNKDIPSDCLYYTVKEHRIVPNDQDD